MQLIFFLFWNLSHFYETLRTLFCECGRVCERNRQPKKGRNCEFDGPEMAIKYSYCVIFNLTVFSAALSFGSLMAKESQESQRTVDLNAILFVTNY